LPRGGVSPLPDPALKRPQLTIRKNAGELTLQAHEELSTDAVGLSLEPRAYTGPRALERIFARPPISRRPGCAAMGGADLTMLPSRRQSYEKGLQIPLSTRHVRGLPGGQCREMVLDRSDFVQQT
jgi:hypothetical protein